MNLLRPSAAELHSVLMNYPKIQEELPKAKMSWKEEKSTFRGRVQNLAGVKKG